MHQEGSTKEAFFTKCKHWKTISERPFYAKYRSEKENIERLLFTKCRPKNGKQKSHIMQTTETLKRQSQKFFCFKRRKSNKTSWHFSTN